MSVRLGLIGAGRWGKRYIQTINQLTEAKIVALATRDPKNAELIQGKVNVVSDWRTLCDSKEVDGVIIATPAAVHGEMLRAFLDAKKPALIEKPLCLNLKEAEELQAHVKRLGVPVLVEHTQLFQPAHDRLLKEFADPKEIRFISSDVRSYGPFRQNDITVLWDWAPHDLAVYLDLIKELPKSVSCFGGVSPDGNPANSELLTLKLTFSDNRTGWINIGHLSFEKCRRCTIYGKNRAFLFDDFGKQKLTEFSVKWDERFKDLHPPMPEGKPVEISAEFPLTQAVREFAIGITKGPTKKFGVDLAVDVVRVLDAAQKSIAENSRTVVL